MTRSILPPKGSDAAKHKGNSQDWSSKLRPFEILIDQPTTTTAFFFLVSQGHILLNLNGHCTFYFFLCTYFCFPWRYGHKTVFSNISGRILRGFNNRRKETWHTGNYYANKNFINHHKLSGITMIKDQFIISWYDEIVNQ